MSKVAIPSRRPAQSDHPVMRRANALASPGREAPSACPMRVCPAIARASSTYCRKLQIVNPTWCAARATAPERAAVQVVNSRAARNARVRISNGTPTSRLVRIPASRGRNPTSTLAALWATIPAAVNPMSVSANAVAAPEPAIPMPRPKTRTMSPTRFRIAAPIARIMGVRPSALPRSVPVAANTRNIPGSPGSDQRR